MKNKNTPSEKEQTVAMYAVTAVLFLAVLACYLFSNNLSAAAY